MAKTPDLLAYHSEYYVDEHCSFSKQASPKHAVEAFADDFGDVVVPWQLCFETFIARCEWYADGLQFGI